MTNRKLPSIPSYQLSSGITCDMAPSALSRWEHDIKASAEEENTISILGAIGEDFFGDGITAKRIAGALRNIGNGKDLTVNINSPGGNVFEGIAIYNLLREHKGKVTVKVLGVAASAASFVAMAGDSIEIAKSGFMMVHNTFVGVVGDRHDMRDVADYLETFDKVLGSIYTDRTGISEKEIGKMMDNETWIGGEEAVKMKFADRLLPADAVRKDASAAVDLSLNAASKLDQLLAKAGTSRSERKKLLAAYRPGKQNAADDTTRNAGADDGLLTALSKIAIK